MTSGTDPALESLTKGEVVERIADLLGIEAPRMSTGSSEPRSIFLDINNHLGLGLDTRSGKPGLARGIVESSGAAWHPDYESRGSTITKAGLIAVHCAVEFFVG
jgi:hypothetical protein